MFAAGLPHIFYELISKGWLQEVGCKSLGLESVQRRADVLRGHHCSGDSALGTVCVLIHWQFGAMGHVEIRTTQAETGMYDLERLDPVGFRNDTACADLTGGDQSDVDPRIGKSSEHPACGAGSGSHPCTHRAHPGNGLAILEGGSRPLGQQRGESHVCAGSIVLAQDEADVAGTVMVLSLGLHDRVQADAVVRQS